MKKNDKVIREGDRIRIVNPEFIEYLGYEMNKEYVLRNLMDKEDADKIKELVDWFQFKHFTGNCFKSPLDSSLIKNSKLSLMEEKIFDRIADEFAYHILKDNIQTGQKKVIRTKVYPDLKGRETFVSRKQIRRTGTFSQGWCHQDYWGEWDSMPSLLENQKTHVVLTTEIYDDGTWSDQIRSRFDKPLLIEAKNVERVI